MVFTSHVTVFIMKHTKENVPATPSTFVIFHLCLWMGSTKEIYSCTVLMYALIGEHKDVGKMLFSPPSS